MGILLVLMVTRAYLDHAATAPMLPEARGDSRSAGAVMRVLGAICVVVDSSVAAVPLVDARSFG